VTTWDWMIVVIPLLCVGGVIAHAQRYSRSVADFMAAGRCAGRYLLANARGEAGATVATAVAIFELTTNSGFTLSWWSYIGAPVGLIISVTGFVIYRYRETRVLTLAQFFEIRYTRRFRLFMGGLASLAGVLNYGVFPAIGAKFFVYFLGLPQTVALLSVEWPTWILIAAAYLSCALFLVLSGGQISLMLGDFFAGIFSQVCYVIIAITVLCLFSWSQISAVLADAPDGRSMLNPFDTHAAADFNLWFVLIQLATAIYGTMAWQNSGGFNSSALTPHDSRMSQVLGYWRSFANYIMLMTLAMGALTFLRDPLFAAQSAPAAAVLDGISNPEVRSQMQVPVALQYLLPAGIKGIFCAVMVLALISGDSIQLHSWGSIFAQDVVLPLLKKPLTPRQHLRLLRWSITGVAVFALGFSILFRQSQFVLMWWMITMALFVSGAGAVIIGGLYWKKGTVHGAWAAVLTGSSLALAGIVIKQTNPGFFLNFTWINLITMISAVGAYVIVSLLTHREDFDMDRMLHRGAYAVPGEPPTPIEPFWQRFRLTKMLGIDGEFTRGDRAIAYSIFGWGMLWFGVVIIGSAWNWWHPWPLAWWSNYWYFSGILLPLIIAMGTTIWFTIGGVGDLRNFFRKLKIEKRDVRDDGTVVGRQNWNDVDPAVVTSDTVK